MRSALAHQADIEFHRTADDLGADALIVAVDGAALLGGEVHGGEAVNMVADGAVMTAVAALYHQVGGNKRALPGARYGGGDLIPCGAVGLTDGTGVHALDAAQFDGVIADSEKLWVQVWSDVLNKEKNISLNEDEKLNLLVGISDKFKKEKLEIYFPGLVLDEDFMQKIDSKE